MVKDHFTPENVKKSLTQAKLALDILDMTAYDAKVNLSLERSQFWMDRVVATQSSLILQTQLIRKTEASLKDGERFMTTGYVYFD